VGFLGVGFLGGCTQKKPPGFFGYIPGCLNPGAAVLMGHIAGLAHLSVCLQAPESKINGVLLCTSSVLTIHLFTAKAILSHRIQHRERQNPKKIVVTWADLSSP